MKWRNVTALDDGSDEPVAIGVEACFAYFGAGPDEVDALSTLVFDLDPIALAEVTTRPLH